MGGFGSSYANEGIKYRDAVKDYCVYNQNKSYSIECNEGNGSHYYYAYDSNTCGNDDNMLIVDNTCGGQAGPGLHDDGTCYILKCERNGGEFTWMSPADSTFIGILLLGIGLVLFMILFIIIYGWVKCWIPYQQKQN